MAEPFAPYAGIDTAALTGGEGGDLLHKLLLGALQGTAQIPQRVIDAAVATAPPGLRREDFTDIPGSAQPGDELRGPAIDAAMMTMGGTAFGAPVARAGEAVMGAGPIRAYHGSPHDFDKFDLSKIGTGEGAQAYGHGLYFAENEGVARGYRDTLAGDYFVTPKGRLFDPQQELEHLNVRSRAHSNGSNLDATIEVAQKMAASDAPSAIMAQRDLVKLQELKAEGGVKRHRGSMYEVNINADPAHFLDWDKPLAADMQAKIQGAARAIKPSMYDRVTETGRFLNKYGLTENIEGKTGETVVGQLKRGLGSDAVASQALREAGIPGIKYLDQGSRFAQPVMTTTPHGDVIASHYPPKTSNYVVFNDRLIDILRKYGIAGAAPVGLLASQASREDGT